MHRYKILFITSRTEKIGIYYYNEEIIASNKIDAINKLLNMIKEQKDSLEKIIAIEKVY